MPCIFCLAVFAMLAGAVTTAVLDEMERQLATVTTEPVHRTVDSESVTAFEVSVPAPRVPGRQEVARGAPVPVRVTVYKKHKRVRIQVLTHAISRAEAEALEDLLAELLGLDVVDRSDAHDEQQVREAFGEEAVAADRRAAQEEQEPEEGGAEEQVAQAPPPR